MKKLLLITCFIILSSCNKNRYTYKTNYTKYNNPQTVERSILGKSEQLAYEKAFLLFYNDSIDAALDVDNGISYINFLLINHKGDTIKTAIGTSVLKKTDSITKIKYVSKTNDSIERVERLERMREYNAMSDSDKRKLHMRGVTKTSFMPYLSNYDGSFPPLVEYTKKNLQNPKTFEHVETGFIIREEYVEVKMVYRAENGFGAHRKESIVAAVDEKGYLIEILRTIN